MSTLAEASFLADGGFDDILYAVPLTPDKVDEVLALHSRLERFTVMVDHRPLVGLSKKCWDQLTVRQARLFEKVQGYLYEVRYLEGKFMYLADFLSRSPVWRGSEEQKLREMMKTDIFSVKSP